MMILITTSLPSKCFRLVSEQRKTEERDFSVLAARKNGTRAKMGGFQNPGICLQAFLSFLPPPRLLAPFFRAVFDSRSSFVAPKQHGNACYAG